MNKRITLLAIGLAALGAGASNDFQGTSMGNLPICKAGPDETLNCNGVVTTVQLDGTGSIDPLGQGLRYRWEITQNPKVTLTDELTATPTLTFNMAGSCLETVDVFLIVTNQVGKSTCKKTVTVGDFEPPTVICPPNAAVPPGGSIDPNDTGFPIVSDNCNPNPTVIWFDIPVGNEKIQRVWRVSDGCRTTTCIQELFFVFNGFAHFDLLPGQCPNGLSVGLDSGGGTFGGGVLGNAVDSSDIDLGSITVSRVTFFSMTSGGTPIGPSVAPVSAVLNDVGTPFIGDQCECTGLGPDGTLDVDLQFDLTEFITVLGLDQVPSGTEVPLLVRGKFLDGTVFEGIDCVLVN